jgi:hypothetical protein
MLVDGGFTRRYDLALQTLTELPYDRWREYDAEDTIRFYALRLHELGRIKSSPQKIIAGTDWRFLNRAPTSCSVRPCKGRSPPPIRETSSSSWTGHTNS